MKNLNWYINRLKNMDIQELFWRLNQKIVQTNEEIIFKKKKKVIDFVFSKKLKSLELDISKMYLNFDNINYSINNEIKLLGNYNYNDYKFDWHAGFQTFEKWPMVFSYKIKYKGNNKIGDARTNWELNRHYQLVKLAKNYYVTKNKRYLTEFKDIFYDWNSNNDFLWGISWTSTMEIAIRLINWCYSFCFLKKSKVDNKLLNDMKIGIINMTDYVVKHYSRYSSANNHLLIEAYAIGQSGILFNYKKWINLSNKIISKEIINQNYEDGINKEMSLHYQAFSMEAIGLLLRIFDKNNIANSFNKNFILNKMSEYIKTCSENNLFIEFGDNDEGKILDINFSNYYTYILELYSVLLKVKYVDEVSSENINWLFKKNEVSFNKCYVSKNNVCYKNGYTILKGDNKKIVIGIDHGNLGFGKIAAHGHSDALSFILFYKTIPVFVDLGTYLYHFDNKNRDYFRKTINHNTVSINEKDQSKILGPFMWGKRAICKINKYIENKDLIVLNIEHNGYKPLIHNRIFKFNKKDLLNIYDKFNDNNNNIVKYVNFNFGLNINCYIKKNIVHFESEKFIGNMIFKSEKPLIIKKKLKYYSKTYGIKEKINSIVITTYCDLETIINIKDKR